MIIVLLQLWWLRQRGVLRQLVRSLKQPVRLIGLLAVLVGFGFVIWAGSNDQIRGAGMTRDSFAILGAMLFTMGVASGFVQEGPRFTSADVDFLFPAPFSPRQLLWWRLLQAWPLTLVSVLLMSIAFGARMARPGRLVIGMALLQFSALHLQLLISVLLTRLSDRAAKRLRGVGRTVTMVVLFGGLLYLVVAVSQAGGLSSLIAPVATSSVARIVLFPAAACVDFVFADSTASMVLALARLLAAAAGTLALLFVPEVDYLEDSVATTARFARLLSARRRGGLLIDDPQGTRTARSLVPRPSVLLFRGPGALVWKNLLVMARSWKTVVPGLLVGLLIVLPTALLTRKGVANGHIALAALIPATIFWSNALAFDLRREFDRLDELRALPFAPTRLVLAELLVPWVFGVVLQEALLLTIVAGRSLGGVRFAAAAAAMPLLMFVAIVIDNLALFLFAPKGAGRGSSGSAGQALRPIAWMAAIAPGVGVWYVLLSNHFDPVIAITAGLVIDVAIAVLLFFLLVRVYESRAATT